ERRLLAVQQLGEQVGQLVEGGGLLGGLVLAHQLADLGQHRGLGLHHPVVLRDRDRPVEVALGVPLAELALLVERAQLLDLGAVLPGPVQRERSRDVGLRAQALDLGLVDELDHLEAAEALAMLLHELFHHRSPRGCSGFGEAPAGAARPRWRNALTSALRRATASAERSEPPSRLSPNSPEAKW